ncbi:MULTISPECIES: MauE/DoxX family redox-associated membrane protein [unclassified Rathayibacter]|uniref:MauE/DoxX family redox-associated membrane protein n=1 Tax=unclassified Rathayibacter TaxID=2609250 RepID=UPI00188B245B|nr:MULTISPECIES: MauE/DoxX family redox-associated membrane protein [unclassified Rathayibacter]MBF4461253.1 hypothetical protein [Rathayibacter sp. VKM Ac-2879]MBF4502664.1 hypothetical protein [Rathayibacter sp. VKM Ac-2878]
MDLVLTVCWWIAGSVLVASGALKLGRTERFRAGLPALGVPAFLARSRWFAPSFAPLEGVVGLVAILAPEPWSRLALTAAAALFAVFVVVAARAARRPEPVDCECFGGLGDARMTGSSVVRAVAFLALALAGLAAGTAPSALLPSPWWPALVTALAIGVLVVLRNARSHRDTAPEPVVPSPPAADERLVLTTVDGVEIALAEFQEPPTHLVFFSPDCSSCQSLVERFRWWPHGLREGDDLQPVLLGEPEDFLAYEVFAPLVPHALYDPRRIVARRLGLQGTPGHAFVTAEYPLGSGWTAGEVAIEGAVLRPGFFSEEHVSGATQP